MQPRHRRQDETSNAAVVGALMEIARLLERRGASGYRVAAYRQAAVLARRSARPLAGVYRQDGLRGLASLPGIGKSLAKTIGEILRLGHSKKLARLRAEAGQPALLESLPSIGPRLADRIREALGTVELEDVLAAAQDGRLRRIAGLGRKRVEGIRDCLAARLHVSTLPERKTAHAEEPPVADLLDIDREYRRRASSGELMTVAPKRFNPTAAAWLPILHTERRGLKYCAHFANTARSHESGTFHDWVVIYCEDKQAFDQWTIVTARHGPLHAKRMVRGREAECLQHYGEPRAVQLSLLDGPAGGRRG